MTSQETDIERLAKLSKGIQFAMFTTRSSDESGVLRSRPMTLQETEFKGQFWFFAGKDSAVFEDVQTSPIVNLTFSQPKDQTYVSLSGMAEVSFDKEKIKELWSPFVQAWFPEGPDDPNVALICVHVESADIWESPNSKVVQLYGFAKAAITGKPPKEGEIGKHTRVTLNN